MPVPGSAQSAYACGVEPGCWPELSIHPRDCIISLSPSHLRSSRARVKHDARGLDAPGLTGVIGIDRGPHADVAGMCTYGDLIAATTHYGLSPLVVPQLRTITLGGAVTSRGIRVSVVPQRPAPRVVLEMDILTGAGELHRLARTALHCTVHSLTRMGHWAIQPASNPAGAGPAVCRAAARPVPKLVDGDGGRNGRIIDTGGLDGEDRWMTSSTGWFSALTKATCAACERAYRARSATTGQDIYRSIQHEGRDQGEPVDHPRLLALGHRLVLVLTSRLVPKTRVLRRWWLAALPA